MSKIEKKWRQWRSDKVMKTCNRCALWLLPPRSKHSQASKAKQHLQEGKHRLPISFLKQIYIYMQSSLVSSDRSLAISRAFFSSLLHYSIGVDRKIIKQSSQFIIDLLLHLVHQLQKIYACHIATLAKPMHAPDRFMPTRLPKPRHVHTCLLLANI
jgi:hypothetical protein